ncbi:unnamed protein product [Urochloa humidicola]
MPLSLQTAMLSNPSRAAIGVWSEARSAAASTILFSMGMVLPFSFGLSGLPSRVKLFSWLLYNQRLQTRANLCHKNIKPREESNCQKCPTVLEMDTHLFLSCPAAIAFWNKLRFCVQESEYRTPWLASQPVHLPNTVWPDIILVLLRQMWLSRNALIFDKWDNSADNTLRDAIRNLETWKYRYKNKRLAVEAWIDFLKSQL